MFSLIFSFNCYYLNAKAMVRRGGTNRTADQIGGRGGDKTGGNGGRGQNRRKQGAFPGGGANGL